MVMCSVWKIPVALGKHYIGYKLKRGKEEDRRLQKDISQMNATWDKIYQTATERHEWRV